MKQFMKKAAFLLALVMLVTAIPLPAKAATTPAFRATKKTVYENSSANGVYKYTVSGVQKGYKIKWGITGTGKKYVTLKYKTTTATKTTSSNKITIDTNGATGAKNAKFNVVAKVYDKSGKLVKTVKDKPTIKINAETINLSTAKVGSLEGLAVGKAYDFDAAMTPANTTSKVYWAVTDANGADYSSQITSEGVWTPKATGEYTVTATARNSATGKALCTQKVNAVVGVYIKSATQTGANKLSVVFSGNVTDLLNADNVTIQTKVGSGSVIPKVFEYDTVGKTVTITTNTNFKNGTEYVVTYGTSNKTFVASVGKPVSIKILTDTVPVDTFTTIEWAVLDANGMDVTNAYPGKVTMDGTVINGTLTDGVLHMTDVGKTATISLSYELDDGNILNKSQKITCVEATVEDAKTTNFTITQIGATPDYEVDDYKDIRTIAMDEKGQAHFRALDSKGMPITYDSVVFDSSNDDVLIVSSDGELTPIITGTAKVFVTVKRGSSEMSYTYPVTIQAARELAKIKLDTNTVSMSTSSASGYAKTIGMAIYDQYGMEMDLTEASVTIDPVGSKDCGATITADVESGLIVIERPYLEGTYNYKVTATLYDETVTATFALNVKEIPYNSTAVNYIVELSNSKVDMAVDENTEGNIKTVIRLAQYRGGVFETYKSFDYATIKKGKKYYGEDLTVGGSTTEMIISGGDSAELTVVDLSASSSTGTCTKAEAGNYSISIRYTNENYNEKTTTTTLVLSDTQKKPVVTKKRSVASVRVDNALDLVKNCLSVESAVFTDCTVTGETEEGINLSIGAGDKIHIKTVTVREEIKTASEDIPKVYVYHTITVSETLTNR